jgi:hypothetical protein
MGGGCGPPQPWVAKLVPSRTRLPGFGSSAQEAAEPSSICSFCRAARIRSARSLEPLSSQPLCVEDLLTPVGTAALCAPMSFDPIPAAPPDAPSDPGPICRKRADYGCNAREPRRRSVRSSASGLGPRNRIGWGPEGLFQPVSGEDQPEQQLRLRQISPAKGVRFRRSLMCRLRHKSKNC